MSKLKSLSAMHCRVNSKIGKTTLTRLPIKAVPVSKDITIDAQHQLPTEPHIEFMGVEDVLLCDLTGLPVLSLSDERMFFPTAKEHVQLYFQPGSTSTEHLERLMRFINDHIDEPRIIVHCSFGEQHSRAMAKAIKDIIDTVKDVSLSVYRYCQGTWFNCTYDEKFGDYTTYNNVLHHSDWERKIQVKSLAA
jgi:hypothetical protein